MNYRFWAHSYKASRFSDRTKAALGIKALGREVIRGDGVYELREPRIPYGLDSGDEIGDLRTENMYFGDTSD